MPDRPIPVPAGRFLRVLRTLTIVGSVGYLLALVGATIAMRYVGEQSWLTVVVMYLPRIGFAVPLPFLVAATLWWGPRALLPLHLLAVLLLVFPLMGLTLGTGWMSARASGAVVRVVSFNIDYGRRGAAAVAAHVRPFAPDVVLLQEATADFERDSRAFFAGWNVHRDGQFLVASRFPIHDVVVPPPIGYAKGTGGAHFVRYTLQTPLGEVDVFNVHTTSPREGLEELRGRGLRDEITSGRLFASAGRETIKFNAYRRRRQVEGLAAAAAASPRAVIIAGDTNLPGLSWILGEQLTRFRDAFGQVGLGFGYTFPATRPWMRIDRILTNDRLRALDSGVGTAGVSDHRCVFAVIAADR